jgi:acyl homoserine lactone synthase
VFITVQAHEYKDHASLLDQMHRLRKRTFHDQLQWDVPVVGDFERDQYDDMQPAYLIWCSDDKAVLYGSIRLMPTTGPTLLYDVFRDTFQDSDLVGSGIWEGTRLCIDEEKIRQDFPTIAPRRAFSLLLLALCECALAHGIHTMISNYEPATALVYRRSGVAVTELGRSDRHGKHPVCCGIFEVSKDVLSHMRRTLRIDMPVYTVSSPARPVASSSSYAA